MIREHMAYALITETCANFSVNRMETQNNFVLDTCVRSLARFPWFFVELFFLLSFVVKERDMKLLRFGW